LPAAQVQACDTDIVIPEQATTCTVSNRVDDPATLERTKRAFSTPRKPRGRRNALVFH
jgi:hypothetical protein